MITRREILKAGLALGGAAYFLPAVFAKVKPEEKEYYASTQKTSESEGHLRGALNQTIRKAERKYGNKVAWRYGPEIREENGLTIIYARVVYI